MKLYWSAAAKAAAEAKRRPREEDVAAPLLGGTEASGRAEASGGTEASGGAEASGGDDAPTPPRSRAFRFTRARLLALPPHDPASPSREMEYCDTEVRGLRLLVGKTGRKYFYLRVSVGGRKRVARIGEFPSIGLREARARARALRTELDRGRELR